MLTDLISQQDQDRIKRFVDDVFIPRCNSIAVNVPEEMVAGPCRESEWTPWKPIESPVTNRDIFQLESKAKVKLPPLFRAYLMYKCLLMTDFGVRLPETPSNAPLDQLREYLDIRESTPFYITRHLVPFGYDSNDAGPICFDVGNENQNGDYPIVLVDLGCISHTVYTGTTIAGSFSALLDSIEADLLSYD